jgi:hypothetical protein
VTAPYEAPRRVQRQICRALIAFPNGASTETWFSGAPNPSASTNLDDEVGPSPPAGPFLFVLSRARRAPTARCPICRSVVGLLAPKSGDSPGADRAYDCSAQPNKPFAISAIPRAFTPHTLITRPDAGAPVLVRSTALKGGTAMRMENDMTGKITAIFAAAMVLASAGVASAQTHRHASAQWQALYANSYYNQDTRNLRYGHANDHQFDPYVEGIAPY